MELVGMIAASFFAGLAGFCGVLAFAYYLDPDWWKQ